MLLIAGKDEMCSSGGLIRRRASYRADVATIIVAADVAPCRGGFGLRIVQQSGWNRQRLGCTDVPSVKRQCTDAARHESQWF